MNRKQFIVSLFGLAATAVLPMPKTKFCLPQKGDWISSCKIIPWNIPNKSNYDLIIMGGEKFIQAMQNMINERYTTQIQFYQEEVN